MKKLFIAAITFYQQFLSLPLRLLTGSSNACRFPVSCSVYAKDVIEKYGMIRGGKMALVRLFHCQPLSKRTMFSS